MQSNTLVDFLARHLPDPQESAVWGDGTLPLAIISYLSDQPPPEPYVTSIRSLVFRGTDILVMTNADSTHIVPGGRREPGETWEETLRRELLEESGWHIGQPRQIGFSHFHHLAPRPSDYPYPHPDFVQVIFMAEADHYEADMVVTDDYEHDATFQPIADVQALPLTPGESFFLEAAIEYRAAL